MAAADKVDGLCGEIVEELGVPEEDQYEQADWLAENCEQILAQIDAQSVRRPSAEVKLNRKLLRARFIAVLTAAGVYFLLQNYLSRPWWQAAAAAAISFFVLYLLQAVAARANTNLIDPNDPFWAEDLAQSYDGRVTTKDLMATLELAEAFIQSRAFNPAKVEMEKALSYARQFRDPDAIRYCHDSLGNALLGIRDFESAERHFQRALRIARMRGDNQGEFAALRGLGECQGLQRNHEGALSIFEQALDVAKRDHKAEVVELAVSQIAVAESALGRHKDALGNYKVAADIALRRGNKNKHSFYLQMISQEAGASGNDEEGLEFSRKVLDMAREARNRSAEAGTLMNIGVHYRNLSQFEEALKSLELALETAQLMVEEKPEVFDSRKTGPESLMDEFYEGERNDHKRLKADIYRNLAGVYTDLSDYDHSLEYSLEALREAESIGDKDLTMRSLRGVGISYGRREHNARAIEYHKQALELAEQLDSLSYREWCLGILGVTYRKLGDLNRSIDYLSRALPLARQLGDGYTKVCLFDLGESYYLRADYDRAYHCLTESMALTESVRGGMETERARISLAESHTRLAELTVLTCLRLRKEDEAFEYAERGKSRTLIDLLGNARLIPRDYADQQLLEEAERLREQVERLRLRLLESSANRDGERSGEEALARLLREDEEREREVWQKIWRSNPEFASLKQVDPLSRADLDAMLNPDQALIEFFATSEELICFVASVGSLQVERIPLSRAQLGALVLAEVTRDNRGLLSASLSGLYQSLIAPIVESLRMRQIEHLIIAPHGMLHLLPFGALFDAADGDRLYLLDEFAISYTPSASVLKFALEKLKSLDESVLAIENPDGSLEFARAEVATITNLFPGTRVLAGNAATRSELLSCVKEFGLAHFACHGVFRGDAPEQSGLLLADGSLTMLDIINQMELKAWVVTLSACQTAKSQPSGGDEVVGLPRAILYAGAPAVVASLWNVNDHATSVLFQEFYADLKRGASPVNALRDAQLATRDYEKDGKRPFRDPYYWAAFVLIGAGGREIG